LTDTFEHLSARDLLGDMVERFHPRLYIACSFQKEASVIMDLVLRMEPQARFFTLDTGLLFRETRDTWRALEQAYRVKVDVFKGINLDRQAALHGPQLWRRDPDACCGMRKVAPLKQALSGVDAWVSGLRREHSTARASIPKLHWDDRHGLWKGNPLADWSDRDVWRYIAEHDVPYNGLHDRGYDSIGCIHCTRPGAGRSGRWPELAKDDCGIHQPR
jgi:phosphoadenosine phosphosulfate reductase